MVKRVPWPGVESARMVPPCCSTICRAMARPRPVPFFLVVKKMAEWDEIAQKYEFLDDEVEE